MVLLATHPRSHVQVLDISFHPPNQGRWKEAEELDVQVMETSRRVLGAEHPDTLTSMNNLAWTWKSQGRVLKPWSCYLRVLSS